MASNSWAQDNGEGTKQAQTTQSAAGAQAAPLYHIEFVVKEVDGSKVINSRNYSTSIPQNGHASIRAGSRVPIATGTYTSGSNERPQTQYQYFDVGANFDCGDAREMEGKLGLRVTAELSSIPPGEQPLQGQNPVVRQNKWTADVIVPLGKPTIIFSSDDVSGKGKMQVELTATPIK